MASDGRNVIQGLSSTFEVHVIEEKLLISCVRSHIKLRVQGVTRSASQDNSPLRVEPLTFVVNIEAGTSEVVDNWVQSRLGTQPKSEPGTKILSQKVVLHWLQGGGPQNIRKEKKTYKLDHPIINKTRKVVNLEDFHLYKDDFIVRNENTRGEAKRYEPSVDAHTLPLFSLAFTKRIHQGYAFTTVWQSKKNGWLERATAVRVYPSDTMLDIDIPATPYGHAQLGKIQDLWTWLDQL